MQLSNIALALTSVLGSKRKPALDLDFSANETLDPRITFSRTSNATRTNAQGLIEYAPHNLLTYSENFDNAVWAKLNATVTANAVTAPDNTLTADKLVEDTATSSHGMLATFSPTDNTTYVVSMYLKASERSKIIITLVTKGGGFRGRLFDLTNGTSQQPTIAGYSTVPSVYGITPIGNGWYRCYVGHDIGAGAVVTNNLRYSIVLDGSSSTYTGDGTSGIYIWGAQLNIGSLQPYYTTSVKNLLGYSQEFSNAAWTKSNSSIDATPVVGPFGYLGAMKLVESAVAGEHNLSEAITYTAGTPYTLSVYAKAGERNFVVLSYGSGAFGAATRAYFNLATGVVGTTVNSPITSIVSIGAGWYRCSITKTATVSAAANTIINETSTDGGLSYTGDGTSGIYIYGAQLSDSASLDTYSYNFGAAPTSSAYYGPRFDYDPVTLAPKGLLIEESRTNLLTYSDQFDNAVWTKGTGVAISSNSITSPDGTATADTITANGGISVTSIYYDSISVTASTSYTFSFYVKLGTLAASDYRIAVYNVSGSSFIAVDITPSQTPNSSSWTRVSYTFTTPVGCTVVRVYPYRSGATVTNATYYLWGAQLEAGSFPTSYIPTTSAQVPRTADNASMTGTNFSSWYNQSEGTVAAEVNTQLTTGYITSIMRAAGYGPRIQCSIAGVLNTTGAYIVDDSGSVVVSLSRNGLKSAFAYKSDDYALSAAGLSAVTDNSGIVPSGIIQLKFCRSPVDDAYLNGHIKTFKYYPTRLPNGDLIALSS